MLNTPRAIKADLEEVPQPVIEPKDYDVINGKIYPRKPPEVKPVVKKKKKKSTSKEKFCSCKVPDIHFDAEVEGESWEHGGTYSQMVYHCTKCGVSRYQWKSGNWDDYDDFPGIPDEEEETEGPRPPSPFREENEL